MKLIISDITDLIVKTSNEVKVIDNTAKIHHCIGCYDCFVKTPGLCVIKDDCADVGKTLGHCDDLIFVSKCTYGGFSPFVKNVNDRSLPYLSPYFTVRNKRMYHKFRYDNVLNMSVYFYGEDITDKERDTATNIIAAFALACGAKVSGILFYNSAQEVKEALVV